MKNLPTRRLRRWIEDAFVVFLDLQCNRIGCMDQYSDTLRNGRNAQPLHWFKRQNCPWLEDYYDVGHAEAGGDDAAVRRDSMMRWEEHTYGVHILKLVQAPHLCPSSIRFCACFFRLTVYCSHWWWSSWPVFASIILAFAVSDQVMPISHHAFVEFSFRIPFSFARPLSF